MRGRLKSREATVADMAKNYNKRPIHLDLLRIRLPVGGVVSILHRISGVLLVLALPYIFVLLQQSLQSPEKFTRVAAHLDSLPGRVIVFTLSILLVHHFLAGIRHLLLDIDIGISRLGGRMGAWLVLSGVLGVSLFIGVCLLR